jgi:hypothetical protein
MRISEPSARLLGIGLDLHEGAGHRNGPPAHARQAVRIVQKIEQGLGVAATRASQS